MDNCSHYKTYCDKYGGDHMGTWTIPSASLGRKTTYRTEDSDIPKRNWYFAEVCFTEDKITFSIVSSLEHLKCSAWMYIDSVTLLRSGSLSEKSRLNTVNYRCCYDLINLTSEDECFQKLKDRPNYSLTFVYRINARNDFFLTSSLKTAEVDSLYNLKILKTALQNSSESVLKESIVFQVGEETESVSKVVLCSWSPVLTSMFNYDMKEMRCNIVTVTDIRMPVIKALVSFCFAGRLPPYDLDFVCELYYAADKYDVAELREQCVNLLLPQISTENIFRLLKLAFSHNDARLKFTVKTWITANIETWVLTNDWKNLVTEEPKISLEILEFLNL